MPSKPGDNSGPESLTPPDLASLLEDVKTIKNILQTNDAPLPKLWRIMALIGCLALGMGLIQYFVPAFRAWSFDEKVLLLWLPAVGVLFVAGIFSLASEMKRIGSSFLGQFRIRNFFYTRLVLGPAVLTLGYLLSRNPQFSLDGVVLVLLAIILANVNLIVPRMFGSVPFGILLMGFVELIFDLRGPEIDLLNAILLAGGTGIGAGLLFLAGKQEAGRV